VVNTFTNKVSRLLGKDETVRWMNIAIYQGRPSKKSINTVVSMPGSRKPRWAFQTHLVCRRLWRLLPTRYWLRRG